MMGFEIRQSLAKLQPYHVEDAVWKIKLDANENNNPLPPAVVEQISQALGNSCLQRYPSSDEELRSLIAANYTTARIGAENVVRASDSLPRSTELAVACHQ